MLWMNTHHSHIRKRIEKLEGTLERVRDYGCDNGRELMESMPYVLGFLANLLFPWRRGPVEWLVSRGTTLEKPSNRFRTISSSSKRTVVLCLDAG
jgi:hypothetical protein